MYYRTSNYKTTIIVLSVLEFLLWLAGIATLFLLVGIIFLFTALCLRVTAFVLICMIEERTQ